MTQIASTTYSLFAPSVVPPTPVKPDAQSVNVGVQLSSSVAGTITGIRFFQGSTKAPVSLVSLYVAGKLVVTSSATPSGTGWQTVNLIAPVSISAGQPIVASVLYAQGGYPDDAKGFKSPIVNGPLTATAGLYTYGATLALPTSTYQNSNYFVDVVFAPSAIVTSPPPPPPSRPGPTNTGATGTLTPSGSINVPAGQIKTFSNLAIKGIVTVAGNATFTNCSFNGAGQPYCAETTGGGVLSLSHCSLTGAAQAQLSGNNITAIACDIGVTPSDAIKFANNCLLQDSYIHEWGSAAGAHADAVQMVNGVGTRIIHNTFNCPWGETVNGVTYKPNSCLFINGSLFGSKFLSGLDIEDNYFNGGNYDLYLIAQTGTIVKNNTFGDGAQFGPLYQSGSTSAPTFSGNVDSKGNPVG